MSLVDIVLAFRCRVASWFVFGLTAIISLFFNKIFVNLLVYCFVKWFDKLLSGEGDGVGDLWFERGGVVVPEK